MTWHTQNNSTPSTSSQEPAVAFSLTSYLDTIQSERAKSKNTRAASCTPGNATASCPTSPSGTTSAPSMETLGAASSMSFAEGSLARTLAPQGKALALMASEAVYGERWHASFAKYDHDLHLWKTPQCSLLGDYIEFSETWPRWGMMQNGVCSERVTPEPGTSVIESGFSENLPTPKAGDAKGQQWRTNQAKGNNLPREVAVRWATPCTRDYKGANGPDGLTRNDGKSRMDQLPNQVAYGGKSTPQTYPTPRCFMHKDALTDRGKSNLGEVINDKEKMTKTGQLNPSWVEWLMGWPIGWTDLRPLETDKFRNAQLWHGEF